MSSWALEQPAILADAYKSRVVSERLSRILLGAFCRCTSWFARNLPQLALTASTPAPVPLIVEAK